MAAKQSGSVGRGWHGDSAGHAAAGRLGGRANKKRRTSVSEGSSASNTSSGMADTIQDDTDDATMLSTGA
jgi:hypothetical protein